MSGVELFNQIKNGVIYFEISESVLYSRVVKQLYCERKSFVHNHSDMINMVFGDYRLVKFIGKGELGIVYLAQHQENGSFAACKILRPELQASGSAIQKFVCEAKTAAKFDHPNIIKAIGYGVEEGYHYFLMEYVDGSSLEYLRLNNPEMLSIEFLCSRFAELADALDYVWHNSLATHGDIKPDNILISMQNKKLKLADLGLAHTAFDTVYNSKDIMATPLYLAPELARGTVSKSTVKSDIYSFGIMFYELVCGEPPFSGSVEELLVSHINEVPAKVIDLNPDVPYKLSAFIDSLIAKKPADRPEDWKAVSSFLRTVLLPQDPVAGNCVKKSTKRKGVIIATILSAAVIAALTAAVVLLWTLIRSQNPDSAGV